MQRVASILGALGKVLFLAGFLVVCVVGTATEIPFHLFGLPLAACGALLLAGSRELLPGKRELPVGIAVSFALALAYFLWRAWVSPVRPLGEMDMFLVAAAASGFLAGRAGGSVRWMLPWLVLVVFAGLAVSMRQLTVDPRFTVLGHWHLGRPEGIKYASGFFHNYNPYGAWSGMLAALFLAALVGGGGKWTVRMLAIAGLAGAALGVVLSFSRAAFFGTITGGVAVLLLFFVVLSRWRAKPGIKLAAFVVGVVVTALLAFLALRWIDLLAAQRAMGASLEGLGENLGSRDLYWRTGLSQFLSFQWIGGGARSYSYLSYRFWEMPDWGTPDPYYAHNEYVQTLADYGLVGLVVAVGFLLHLNGRSLHLAMVTGRHDATGKGRAKVTACLAVSGVSLAAAADAFFSFNLHFAPQWLFLGFLAGVFSTLAPPGFEPKPRTRLFRLAASAAAGAVLLVGMVPVAIPGIRYAAATFRTLEADAALARKEIDRDQHLAILEQIAGQLSRYPFSVRVAETCLARANDMSIDTVRRVALADDAERWLSKALDDFPQSVEAWVLRGHAHWAANRYGQAEEDLLRAAELGRKREFTYRSLLLVGELRYARALESWEARDVVATCRFLASSLDAYQQSQKRAGLNPRGKAGLRQVQEMIAFLKRTGEWQEP